MTEITYTLEDLRGVGCVELALRPDQRAYVFFGSNGVGKTKCFDVSLNLINKLG
jgi:recombinational DNA repair ATPase RecF